MARNKIGLDVGMNKMHESRTQVSPSWAPIAKVAPLSFFPTFALLLRPWMVKFKKNKSNCLFQAARIHLFYLQCPARQIFTKSLFLDSKEPNLLRFDKKFLLNNQIICMDQFRTFESTFLIRIFRRTLANLALLTTQRETGPHLVCAIEMH